MKHTGRVVPALVVGAAVLVAMTLAFAATKAPDKEITIESKDVFKERTKAPVVFAHLKHKDVKCAQCHHEYKDGKNVWEEGQEVKKCGACHKLEDADKVFKLKTAMHNQCVECHKKMKKEKKQTGPTACTKCHPKKPGEKDDDKEEK
ncbi:MAG: cytochrome c3 family protein [Deltaproteobacteria bacterium]|nr:cytochrome c3 family protein [Deltaproteobacteria bacterium]